jgi:hypothetical protein
MMAPVQTAVTHGRRSLELARRREPLRIAIGRRRARSHAGGEKFITQVRFGDGEAIVVPWNKALEGARGPGSPPVRARGAESLV